MLLLAGQALANWEPGTWYVGSHDGSMPKCDYKKYPEADFNPDDFAATGHGCDNFPLRLCEHDENLWPGGVHHNNMTCLPYSPPKHKNCSTLNLDGFWDPACLPETNNCENGTNVNCNIDVKRDCFCLHKNLFPMVSRELVGTMVFVIAVFIAACAGIGGGGLNVPIFILLFGFMIKEATPLSHSAVMANSFAQFLINWPIRHTQCDQPVLDYVAPLVLLPAQLAGNNLGVLLSPVIPADVLYILSICLLAMVTAKVARRAVHTYNTEKAGIAAKQLASAEASEKLIEENLDLEQRIEKFVQEVVPGKQTQPVNLKLMVGGEEHEATFQAPPAPEGEIPLVPMRGQIFSEDVALNVQCTAYLTSYQGVQKHACTISVVIWGVFSVFYVLIKEATKCSGSYWGIFTGMYVFLLAAVYVGMRYSMNQNDMAQKLVEAGVLELFPSYVGWGYKNTAIYGSISVAIGFVGGILGLGGAEFMAPLMLEMGMTPARAAATAAYMNMFTSASNIIHYTQISGTLPHDYTVYFCMLSLIAGLVGRSISSMIAATGRQSVVIFALSAVLGTSGALLAYRMSTEDAQWGSKSFC